MTPPGASENRRWTVALVLIIIFLMLFERQQRENQAKGAAWRHCIRHDAPWDCPS